jgi:hypothetical protein
LLKKTREGEMRLAFRAALAIQRESPLGGCAAGMANLGGGGHPGCAGVNKRAKHRHECRRGRQGCLRYAAAWAWTGDSQA